MAPVAAATAARGFASRYFTSEGAKRALTVAATQSGKLSKTAGEGTAGSVGNPGNPRAAGAAGALRLAGTGRFTGLKVEYVIAALLVLFVPVADREAVSSRSRFGNWVRQLLAITLLYAVLIMVAAIGPRSKRLMTLVGFLFLLGIALSNRFGAGTNLLPRIFDAIVRILSPQAGGSDGAGAAVGAGRGRGPFAAAPGGSAGGGGGGGGGGSFGSSPNGSGGPNADATGGGGNAGATGRSGRESNRRGNPRESPGIPSLRRRGSSDLNNSPVRLPEIKPPPQRGPVVAGPRGLPWLGPGRRSPFPSRGWDAYIDAFNWPGSVKPPTPKKPSGSSRRGGGTLPDIDRIVPRTKAPARGRAAPSIGRRTSRAPIPRFSNARTRRITDYR